MHTNEQGLLGVKGDLSAQGKRGWQNHLRTDIDGSPAALAEDLGTHQAELNLADHPLQDHCEPPVRCVIRDVEVGVIVFTDFPAV